MNKAKLSHKLQGAALVLTAILVGVSLFLTLRPYNEITYGDYYVSAESYKRGELVPVTISEFCTTGTPNTVERWIVSKGGALALAPLRFENSGIDEWTCFKDLVIEVRIPPEAQLGASYFEFYTRYEPNPIKTEKVYSRTPYFEVTK